MTFSIGKAAFVAFAFAFLAPALAVAQSDEDYTAEDVIAHFTKNLDLGTTRSLCIGTPSECGDVNEAAAAEPAEDAAPFDLRVNFRLNSSELTPEAKAKLDAFAQAMMDRRLRRAYFNIEGHTDARGGDAFNQTLSERRAAAVVDYLALKGVDASRLIARGYGESRPLADDPFADINRRVEASIARLD